MSVYDQRSLPMWAAFDCKPNMKPWDTLQPSVIPFADPGYPVNTANTALARACAKMNFTVADAVDDDILREAIEESFQVTATASSVPEAVTRHLHTR